MGTLAKTVDDHYIKKTYFFRKKSNKKISIMKIKKK